MIRLLYKHFSYTNLFVVLLVSVMAVVNSGSIWGIYNGVSVTFAYIIDIFYINTLTLIVILLVPLNHVFDAFQKETKTMHANYQQLLKSELEAAENNFVKIKRRIDMLNIAIVDKEREIQSALVALTHEVDVLSGIRISMLNTLSASTLQLSDKLSDLGEDIYMRTDKEFKALIQICDKLKEAITNLQNNEFAAFCGKDLLSLEHGTINVLLGMSEHTRVIGKFFICILEGRSTEAYNLLDEFRSGSGNGSGTFTKQEKTPKARSTKGRKVVSPEKTAKAANHRVEKSKNFSL